MHFKPDVVTDEVLELVQHLDDLERDGHRLGDFYHAQVGIDDLEVLVNVLGRAPVDRRHVEELELIAHVPQDARVELAVVVEAAAAVDLHEAVRPQLQRLQIAAHTVFKGRTDVVGARSAAQLQRAPRDGRRNEVLDFKPLLADVFEGIGIVRHVREACHDLLMRHGPSPF